MRNWRRSRRDAPQNQCQPAYLILADQDAPKFAYAARRLAMPSKPEPKSHTAAGTGTLVTLKFQ